MKTYFYLIHIQYLGFRYHGWLKQPGLKTIESMLEKTTQYCLGHFEFKILGTSRTDAKVSASHSAFELFVSEPLDLEQLQHDFNTNLPNDIRVINVEEVDKDFNIIQTPKTKEYLYLFSYGEKFHPFCASLLCSFPENLNIERMKKGALLFQGTHNFRQYCTKPKPNTVFHRRIETSIIKENTQITASFFPDKSYCYQVISKGFLRNQVRLMMGQLLRLGQGKINLDDMRISLRGDSSQPLKTIAPASGLILNKIQFDTNVEGS
ncbi:MAG: tRNA pseudouridine(38-40) synthase TruA [Desulfobacula sp.]|nr:tRNA pseudouridine(38-40) synthase TruA [Desulfobacula sp.]